MKGIDVQAYAMADLDVKRDADQNLLGRLVADSLAENGVQSLAQGCPVRLLQLAQLSEDQLLLDRCEDRL
jgi:hypothetical protein